MIKPGKFGFCGVRGNVGGKLHTFNWGKSVSATQEYIETEAVNHYSPNAKILSLGNIGCMMCCDFCQNWETSQVHHLNDSSVNKYTPEQIVDICKNNKIDIISWTYNDPVVWHEFVKETSILAHKHGIKTLYKSAFYIESEPVEELLEYIDIFSISLKSMDAEFYRKSGGELLPVLNRIKQVFDAGKHLEISQLIVTDRNDKEEEIQKTIDWMMNTLDKSVPLHFVAFHPAYKYIETTRTSPEILIRARELALKSGLQYVYIGNVYDNGFSDTNCLNCGGVLVERFGLTSNVKGVTKDAKCASCGADVDIKYPFKGINSSIDLSTFECARQNEYFWNNESKALHLELNDSVEFPVTVVAQHIGSDDVQQFKVDNSLRRIIISKGKDSALGVLIKWDLDVDLKLYPVLDRAHFPVIENIDVSLLGVSQRKKL